MTGLLVPKNGNKNFKHGCYQVSVYLRTKKFNIGYVPQYGGVFMDLTLNDNLKAISEIVIDGRIIEEKK